MREHMANVKMILFKRRSTGLVFLSPSPSVQTSFMDGFRCLAPAKLETWQVERYAYAEPKYWIGRRVANEVMTSLSHSLSLKVAHVDRPDAGDPRRRRRFVFDVRSRRDYHEGEGGLEIFLASSCMARV